MIDVTRELRRLMPNSLPQLHEEYERACGEPPRSNNRTFLIKRIIWRLQAAASGGLSDRARQRARELGDDTHLRMRPPPAVHAEFKQALEEPVRPAASLPPPGSIIKKTYKGRKLEIRVLERGFELDGTVHPSASALAKAVTGSNWNGRLFLGLTSRRGA